ncbi:MAG: tRNA1(Val) (adenine(37)-N6)-methyltransferase [Nannocystaceae bacterium]
MTPPTPRTSPTPSGDHQCPEGGWVRAPRRPDGWVPPGPRPAGPGDRDDLWPGKNEDLCFLTGDFRIFQRTDGHRWSLDDLLTAWRASSWTGAPAPARILDLGCGIGSVLMMLAWKFERAALAGIEAQDLSIALARRSVAYNGIATRAHLIHGDLRIPSPALDGQRFDRITGTPPYFERRDGVVSTMPQKGPCRFEVRGGVEGYFAAAARHLTPDGMFTVCEDARQTSRVEAAALAHGFRVLDRLDAIGRTGKSPLVSVFRCTRGDASSSYEVETLTVRNREGQWTPGFTAIRADMGLPPKITSAGADRIS